MKKHIAYTLLLFSTLLVSCEKDPPFPSIEGHWVDMTGTFAPDWHYHFDDGLLTQEYFVLGVTLASLTYPYAIRDSTIIIGGDATNNPREWTIYFECNDVVQITQTSDQLSPRFWLKRVK